MKIAFKFLTLIFLISAISSVKCDTLKNKFQTHLDTLNLHLTQFIEYLESFTIKSHNFLKDDLKLTYPTDVLVFMIMGIVLYYIFSLFGRKQNFIYNQPDNPDYSGLLNTKIKEMTNLIKASNKMLQPREDKHENETRDLTPVKQMIDKINENLDNLSNIIEKVENEFKTSTSQLDEYLPIISNSQESILTSIKRENIPDGEL